jgi:cyclic pyranopterin monophosphate synthase
MDNFTHIDNKGKAVMVDISEKKEQLRIATASGEIKLKPATIEKIKQNTLKKGDVLSVARIAGIQAAKATSELIPLCHPLKITRVVIEFEVFDVGIKVNCKVNCIGQTGVEMEALTGTSVALLTVYDMCKAIDKTMQINNIRLVKKEKKEF